jgi:hypothetical protein
MANRVTANEVREIFDTDLLDENLNAFIMAANLLVTDLLTGVGYSTALLKEIERWLAAHFAAHMDPVSEDEEMGDGKNRYMLGKRGMGLEGTPYGAQVKLLDYLGIIGEAGKPAAFVERALEVDDA